MHPPNLSRPFPLCFTLEPVQCQAKFRSTIHPVTRLHPLYLLGPVNQVARVAGDPCSVTFPAATRAKKNGVLTLSAQFAVARAPERIDRSYECSVSASAFLSNDSAAFVVVPTKPCALSPECIQELLRFLLTGVLRGWQGLGDPQVRT